MIVCEVKVTYRDDKEEIVESLDMPFFGDKFITLYPYKSSLSRRLILTERVSEVEWDYKVKESDDL